MRLCVSARWEVGSDTTLVCLSLHQPVNQCVPRCAHSLPPAKQVLDCPGVCPKRRSLQSCVEECTGRMDDRQQMTYTQFFGDVLK